jgi:hypothetical protein
VNPGGYHEVLNVGDQNGRVEVDVFHGDDDEVFLEVIDTSGPGVSRGVVVCTSAEARKLARRLKRAARVADGGQP